MSIPKFLACAINPSGKAQVFRGSLLKCVGRIDLMTTWDLYLNTARSRNEGMKGDPVVSFLSDSEYEFYCRPSVGLIATMHLNVS